MKAILAEKLSVLFITPGQERWSYCRVPTDSQDDQGSGAPDTRVELGLLSPEKRRLKEISSTGIDD